MRLLTRTTRSVSTTQAGERLLATVKPALDSIDEELAAVGELRDKPAAAIRITTASHAANTVVWPALEKLLPSHPDIHVEVCLKAPSTNIVEELRRRRATW